MLGYGSTGASVNDVFKASNDCWHSVDRLNIVSFLVNPYSGLSILA